MLKSLHQLLIDALTVNAVIRVGAFLTHQFFVLNTDYMIEQFYVHAKAFGKKNGHPKRNALKCPDCRRALLDLPN